MSRRNLLGGIMLAFAFSLVAGLLCWGSVGFWGGVLVGLLACIFLVWFVVAIVLLTDLG